MPSQRLPSWALWLMLIGVFYFLHGMLSNGKPMPEKHVPISEFVSSVEHGKIGWVRIEGGDVYGLAKDKKLRYVSYAQNTEKLREILYAKRVGFRENRPSDNGGMMLYLLPSLLLIGLILYSMKRTAGMMRGAGDAAQAFGKNKGRLMKNVPERFEDVAGVDEAVESMRELVDFLKDPKKSGRLGGQMPKGTLLVGPPGTGKTLLARALAGEAGVNFISISGSDFVEMFVGVGAARMRDLFEEAKKNAPSIIFIDEIDALGNRGGTAAFGGHTEKEQTINQILTEMDGFGPREGVMVIGATNRSDVLDPAMLRPGRFDRHIYVGLPDVRGREAILKVHCRKRGIKVATDLDYVEVARSTSGFSGADIENLANEAALLATREDQDAVRTEHFIRSMETVAMGAERKGALMTPETKRITAEHESGHAVVANFTPEADPVTKVSIIPRGQAGGYTMMLPEEDQKLHKKSYLLGRIKVLLGGRAAETDLLGVDHVTSGASDDLTKATELARLMVTRLGMSSLGERTFGRHEQSVMGTHETRDYGSATADRIDAEVTRILDECKATVVNLLREKRAELKALSAALLAEETVDARRLEQILGPKAR